MLALGSELGLHEGLLAHCEGALKHQDSMLVEVRQQLVEAIGAHDEVREQLLKSEKEGEELRMLLQNEKRRLSEVQQEFSDAQAQMAAQSEAFRAGVAKIAQLREDEARAVSVARGLNLELAEGAHSGLLIMRYGPLLSVWRPAKIVGAQRRGVVERRLQQENRPDRITGGLEPKASTAAHCTQSYWWPACC